MTRGHAETMNKVCVCVCVYVCTCVCVCVCVCVSCAFHACTVLMCTAQLLAKSMVTPRTVVYVDQAPNVQFTNRYKM